MIILVIIAFFLLGAVIGGWLMMSKFDDWYYGWCNYCAYKIFYLQSIEPEETETDDT